jgi:hypothetical protein
VNVRKTVAVFVVLLLTLCASTFVFAQSTTQGNIRGTVTDPTGAVVPGATVTIHSDDTGQTLTRTSNSTGAFEFSLLPPGHYTLTTTAANYQSSSVKVTAAVGQVSTANVKMSLATQNQTVTVTAEGGVLQISPSISTTMSTEQIQLVPNGAGDLSYIAQTAPGSQMNTQGGYGNFASNGLPAITNNFTVNSMPENDPFLNLNNSGATNVLLGQNDVSEATVVNNGYSGTYQQAGANVNYVSRAGTNAYHGNAIWRWNGRNVNGNNFFNKQSSPAVPRPFVNDNMWAASFGGPIKRDKSFFFVNTEGLYLIVPVVSTVNVPTPQFQAATLANISATQPAELPLYQSMFGIYNNISGVGNAVPQSTAAGATGGCGSFAVAGFGPGGTACASQFHNAVSGNTHEWLITGRYDQNLGTNDKAFVHFRMDRGLQATLISPIDPRFNVTSYQPQYEGQLQWVHTLSSNTVNSFNLNGSYYRAIFDFTDPSAALALQPVEVAFAGAAFSSLGRGYNAFPQGRNVTQYGFVDDFSHSMGNHTLKAGANFARFDVSTFGPGSGTMPNALGENLTDFFTGVASNFSQAFPNRLEQPINLYNLGFYGEDNWRVRPGLNLTLTLRADRNSNPGCVTNCFNRLASNFESLNGTVATPYNQSIVTGLSNALPGSYHPWTLQPRFGFDWTPFGPDSGLVVSGGFGLFGTTLPAAFVDNLVNNLPGAPSFTVSGRPFAPGVANNAQTAAAGAASALTSGFASGATWASLNTAVTAATGAAFAPPNFFNAANDYHTPRFQEWNLQVQKSIGKNSSLSLRYVGNHGIWEQINNTGLNAYCGTAATTPATVDVTTYTPCLGGADTALGSLGFTGTTFGGLPTSPMDPRFNIVTQFSSGYNSNSNGLTVSFLRRFSSFQFQLNYTWSHALDYVSNAGNPNEPFNDNTNISVTNPQNPFNVYQNMYGNADYDIRHYFNANYVYTTPKNWFGGNFFGHLLADWTVAGTIFARTGLPFTVTDTTTGGTLASYGYGGIDLNNSTFGNQIGGFNQGQLTCGSHWAHTGEQCSSMAANFAPSVTGFGNQRRNQVYGPHFFDTDLSLSKEIPIPKWERARISIGAQAFNLFNHPNFDQPLQDVSSSSFGTIQSTVNPPTSIYGAFLGADASPRTFQTQLKLTF